MAKAVVTRLADVKRHEAQWGHLEWYASGALGNSPDMTVGRCVIKPGQSNPRHSHPNCWEVLFVVRGTIRHTISGSEEAEMNPGDSIAVPPGLPHHARNVGKEPAELLISFSTGERKVIGE